MKIDRDVPEVARDIVAYFQLPDTASNFLEARIQKFLDSRNEELQNQIALARQHQRTLTFYKKFISPGDLVFDVGANVGERTEVFRSLGAKVIAVEPHPECVKILKHKFRDDEDVIVVPRALGSHRGIGKLITGSCKGISSLSEQWIDAMKASDRFGGYVWDKKHEVEIDTLDLLVSLHGIPDFLKIDVEGFEDQVLSGVSTPLKTLSFEFNTEFLHSTADCVRKLMKLGPVRFTYSTKETMELHPEWISGGEVLALLARYEGDNQMYGDVYARFA